MHNMNNKNNANNRKFKVLRVGMTYPRDNTPGIGLHGYYYSMYSDYDELILTAKRDGIKPNNRMGVKVVELEASNPRLGTYNESQLQRAMSFVKKLYGQLNFLSKAKPYIRDFCPDIIHVFSPIPLLCGIYARRKCGTKIVMSLHGSDALRMGEVKLLGKLLSIPDAIAIVGDDMVDMLPKDAKIKKPVTCIGNGVDLTVFNNRHEDRKEQFVHVANLRWQKGQQYLIEGFAKFFRNHPGYKLVIIGEGEERESLVNLCANLGVSKNVDFRGTQGREHIANELNRSKAFVLTSVTEGFPKVIIEAMATGTPVISSDVGNVKKVVGDSGYIFQTKDSSAVCAAMERIIESDTQWQTLSNRAEKYAQQYSWESVVERLDIIYRDVLGEH